MKVSIIKIGNSHGVRIPKPILDQCGFGQEVELEVQNKELIIKSPKHPRKSWEKSFKKMTANNDDLLIETVGSEWEVGEWEWE